MLGYFEYVNALYENEKIKLTAIDYYDRVLAYISIKKRLIFNLIEEDIDDIFVVTKFYNDLDFFRFISSGKKLTEFKFKEEFVRFKVELKDGIDFRIIKLKNEFLNDLSGLIDYNYFNLQLDYFNIQ